MAITQLNHPAAALRIHLFGPFEARVNDAPLPRLRSRKVQSLLALLTLRRGSEVARPWVLCLRKEVEGDARRGSPQRTRLQVHASGGNYAAAIFAYLEPGLRLHREVNVEREVETRTLFQQHRAEARRGAESSAGWHGP